MEKDFMRRVEDLELTDDLMSEVLLLYNLGVGIEDLKYFIVLRVNKII